MKQFLSLIILLCFFSCKKNLNHNSQNNVTKREKVKDSVFQFKSIGKSILNDYDFLIEWKVNIYNDENVNLKKEDIDAQNKLQEIDYFNELKGSNIEILNYQEFVKNDSLLKLSKIDSLSIVDSYLLGDNKKISTLKVSATLEDNNYEMPLKIYKIDLVLFDKSKFVKSVNLYSEIDYPFSTKQSICYLDNSGKLVCKKFDIEEDKVLYKGMFKSDVKKIFDIK